MTLLLDRRQFVSGSALLLARTGLGAASGGCAQRAGRGGRRLPIPPLIDSRAAGGRFALTAQAGQMRFFGDAASSTRGFNGAFLGPTVRLHRGDLVQPTVTNRLEESTTVHWHGLLIAAAGDGGPHHLVEPGRAWRPELTIDQPPATLWYHAHPHPRTGQQVYSGLSGMLIVDDGEDDALGLPSTYGVDDIPLIIRDGAFDNGLLVYPDHPMVRMHGARGAVILANGAVEPMHPVPRGVVRLRLVNSANARAFDLSASDGRPLHWIGTDGGYLERPVVLDSLLLAPGQRAEILVDLGDGRPVTLRTGRDPTAQMGAMGTMGGGGGMGMRGGRQGMGMMGGGIDPLAGPRPVVTLEPDDRRGLARLPDRLVTSAAPNPSRAARRRRLTLTMGMGMGMGGGRMRRGGPGGRGAMAGMFGIDGAPFDMARIDHQVRLGDIEIWEVSGEMMPHPYHMHGVHFHVLSRGGRAPAAIDQGPRDTVLVEEPVELLVRFTRPTEAGKPFMFHCHTLEHEDGGMMGQFTVS